MHKLNRYRLGLHPHRIAWAETALSVIAAILVFSSPAMADIKFQHRSLLVHNPNPGAVSKYTLSLTYATATTVGSLDMQFCVDPIPYMPCNPPAGLNVDNAVLSDQVGETGYSISSHSPNHLVLSRTPGVVGNTPSSYTFDNIVNPTDMSHSFAIRLSNYSSTNATGPKINVGAVVTMTVNGIDIATQVPPILIFCVAQQVTDDCSTLSGGNYSDMGTLSTGETLTAQSQMAAGTNASQGYAITINGSSLAAGNEVIPTQSAPTASVPGTSQFGVNLVANSLPGVGQDPDGAFTNAVVNPNYAVPNKFMFRNGDEVAGAPNVSLVRRFTTSYIVNTSSNLKAGVYSTTLTYICSGRF